jgi:hypothetical protein
MGVLDCMPELKSAVDTAKEIRELKKALLQKAEELRTKMGAYSVKIEIETDCDKEQMCDIHINIG